MLFYDKILVQLWVVSILFSLVGLSACEGISILHLITVNLCSQELDVAEEMEMTINYTYKDSGRQLMILDIGTPVSLAGISWMEQYLQEFGLTIEQMNSVPCKQPFVFGPLNSEQAEAEFLFI